MSLLGAACALVCAALLDGARADVRFGPWTQDEFFFGLCHTEHTGYRTRKIFNVPEILIESDGTNFTILIPDLCQPDGLERVGLVVTVCDPNTHPNLTLMSVAEGSVKYSQPRPDNQITLVSCHIKEFCN